MILQLALQTRVIILMHTCEEVLTTNTVRLAAKALTKSEIPHSRPTRRSDVVGRLGSARAALSSALSQFEGS